MPGVVVPALFCEDSPSYQKQISTSNDNTPHNPYTDTHKKNNHKKSLMPSMSKDLPPTLTDTNAPPVTHPSSILLDKNVGPPPGQMQTLPQLTSKIKKMGQMQTLPQLTSKIKKMRLRLPHPCIFDVLPSPINKWSATTHPINGEIFGFVNHTLSY